jgi:hypothetical protein
MALHLRFLSLRMPGIPSGAAWAHSPRPRFKALPVLAAGILMLSSAVEGAEVPPAPETTTAQPLNARPTAAQRKEFRAAVSSVARPGTGCFVARYPVKAWVKVDCGPPSKDPNQAVSSAATDTVGNGVDFVSNVAGDISSASGSFTSVTGAASEATFQPKSTTGVPNTYTLQINTKPFQTPACDTSSCRGWVQFIYSSTQCQGASCVFIQYWLLNYKPPCPNSAAWNYYNGSQGGSSGCFVNSPNTIVPPQALSELQNMELTGAVDSSTDTVTLSTGSGDTYTASNPSIVSAFGHWKSLEFNIFGDCCNSTARFSNPTAIVVHVETTSVSATGTADTDAPDCRANGYTGETNNLTLGSKCTALPFNAPGERFESPPTITFLESIPPPPPPPPSPPQPQCKRLTGCKSPFLWEYSLTCTGPNVGIIYGRCYDTFGEPESCMAGSNGSNSATAEWSGSLGPPAFLMEGPQGSPTVCTSYPDGQSTCRVINSDNLPACPLPVTGPAPLCPEGYRLCSIGGAPESCHLENLCPKLQPAHP